VIRYTYNANPHAALVSVITPCYNYCTSYLPETVASIKAQTYPNVEHLVLHCNCGTDNPIYLPEARNRLVTAAKGEYILPLDADDKFLPEAASEMAKYIPHVDVVSCQQAEFGDRVYHYGNPAYNMLTFGGFLLANRIHCASLFRKALWKEIGGYDEALYEAYEDWDFWLRCAKAGKRFFVIPQALFLYRRHAGSLTARVGENNAMAKFRAKWPLRIPA
jgi:glycosyltransferase involved in cell wall biosynthesis